jgi:hypothetical protein
MNTNFECNTDGKDTEFNYQLCEYRISYSGNWLKLRKARFNHYTLIGPIGLIDAGLNLCNISTGYVIGNEVYSHINGNYNITLKDGKLLFKDAHNPQLSIRMSNLQILDLGLSLIKLGHKLNTYIDLSKARYGG